jgi:Xaa-Pro aminopeptidase
MILENLQKKIKLRKIDGFLVLNPKNIRYLTGFTGSSGLAVITPQKRLFFTDFRYKEQAEKEVGGWDIIIEKGRRFKTLVSIIKKLGLKRLGFEVSIPYTIFEILRRHVACPLPIKNLVEGYRKLKNQEEIINIIKAVARAEKAFLKVKPFLKAGVTEKEIALRLDYNLKKEGCRNAPFDIIVASGANSSMPHAKFTDKRIERGDFVIIDWGGESNGYYSDMTRTFLVAGSGLAQKKKIYRIVNAARQKAVIAAKSGGKAKDIDAAARDFIKKQGYAKYFGHATGHGVGLDVHESPSISHLSSDTILEGMVFTVEPGIYIPGLGGVRIEDMVLIKNNSAVAMTGLSRELEIIS